MRNVHERTIDALNGTRFTQKEKDLEVKTSMEALEYAGAAWIAEPVQLLTASGKDVDTHKAICRTDTSAVIGIVGKDWTPIQNADCFAFFDTIVKEKGMRYVKCKMIDGGRKVYLQARLSTGEVRRGDIVENRLTLVNAFDGSSSFIVKSLRLRLLCTNGLMTVDKNLSISTSFRHTKNARERYEQALMVFTSSEKAFQNFLDASKALTQKVIDKEMVKRFLNNCFGDAENESTRIRNQKNQAYTLSQKQDKGNGQGTMWDLYNGVTEYVDHYRTKDVDKAEVSSLFGSGAGLKERAFEFAMAEVGVRK